MILNVLILLYTNKIYNKLEHNKNMVTILGKIYSLDITELDLTGELIRTIPTNINKFTKLKKLNLSHNQIEIIKEDSFDSLISLEELYINNCYVSNIEEYAFKSLTNLKKLFLRGNKLTEIKRNTFKSLINLEELYLSHNIIKVLEDDIFTSLVNLKDLSLSQNQIKEIKDDTFKSLIKLKKLYLTDNDINYLPLSIIKFKSLQLISLQNISKLDIRIQRFISRLNECYYKKLIYCNDCFENNHGGIIKKSIEYSINNLMKDKFNLAKNEITKQLIELKPKCLTLLLCYLDDTKIHSKLLLTFDEIFVKVFGRIINSYHKDVLLKRLDEEMNESECNFFEERITKLINILDGYFDDISVSENKIISSMIINILCGREMDDELKKTCRKKLKESYIEDEDIEKWIDL